MKVCTIDVGLKNLALCVMSCNDKQQLEDFNIEFWDVLNTLEVEQLCTGTTKSGKVCGKKASCFLQESKMYTCKAHAPKTETIKSYKPKGTKDFTLQEMAKAVLDALGNVLQQHHTTFANVDRVEIELQPRVNNKMKLISHVIFGKLVEHYSTQNTLVRFTRASQKLKAYTGPQLVCNLKSAYAKRKWLGIQYARWFFENAFTKTQTENWLDWFEKCNKKDDLSDVLLMAINALHGVPSRSSTSTHSNYSYKYKNQTKSRK